MSYDEALQKAHEYMTDSYGRPLDLDHDARAHWYERFGMLVDFLYYALKREGSG